MGIDLSELREKITDKYYDIESWFRGLGRALRRLKSWLPIIWSDEDWDPEYLYKIMAFKIRRMKINLDTNKRHVGYEKRVKQMAICEELLGRFGFSDFYDSLRDSYKNVTKCKCPPKIYFLSDFDEDGTPLRASKRVIFLTCEYCKSLQKYWWDKEHQKYKDDMQYFLYIFGKHSKSWWD